MPTEIKLWQIEDDRPQPVDQDKLDLESRIENWIRDDIGLVNDDLLVIGQQVGTAYNGIIDLLAMDRDANLVILELKRDRTPRDIVAQTLDYASHVQNLGLSDIEEIASNAGFLNGKSLEEAFSEKFKSDLPDFVNQAHRMYIVASSLDSATERIVEYLSETHGVDINVATFAYFNVGCQELVGRSMLLDEEVVQIRSENKGGTKGRPSLTWEEMRRISEENDIVDLWEKAVSEFTSITQSRRTDYLGAHFSIPLAGGGQILSLVPKNSSSDGGLLVRVRSERISTYFGVSEHQVKEICGEHVDGILRRAEGATDHFFDADRLDHLIDLLKQNAPRS